MAHYAFSKSHRDWSRIWKNGLWTLLLVLLFAVGFLFYAFQINHFSIAVKLVGEEDVILECGETYVEPGAEVYLYGTHMFRDGILLNASHLNMDTFRNDDQVGTYELTYSGSVFGMSAQCSRKVMVVDSISPVITLTEDLTKRWHIGYTAYDNHDGDITDRVKCMESLGRMSFAVMDSSGNPAYVEKSVPFYDIAPPEIELVGGESYVIPVGIPYSEPGFSAIDNADGIVTEQVLAEGEVNWLVPGIYPITYTVIDSASNEAKIVRNVEVMAKERPTVQMPDAKTVYLTFDDGPGPYTEKLLDVLDQYEVKATFFVKDSEYNGMMKEIVDRGHSIGIHSVTHDYASIYASPEAFFEDLRSMQEIIRENTGVVTTLMRFPGGSSNTVSARSYLGIMSLLSQTVQDAGYQYFDWNVDSNDAGGAKNTQTVVKNVLQGIVKQPVSIVLQHDIHAYSVNAVEQIIQWGLEHGYRFQPLTQNSPGFHHPIAN